MSNLSTVVSIVLSLPELDGKTLNEQFDYFFNILGEPEHIGQSKDGIIEWFQYEGDIKVMWRDWVKVGVEKIIFDKEREYGDLELDLRVEEINNHAEGFAKIFGKKPKDCRLYVRSWHDGELMGIRL